LSSDPLFQVTAICADNAATLAASWKQQPDIVLLDINHDRQSTIDVAKKIVAFSKTKIIALSTHLDLGYGNHMLGAGATGYITKLAPAAEMLLAVREVAKGNVYICNESKGLLNSVPSPYSLPDKQQTVKNNDPAPKGEPAENHWHQILRFPN
jgi:DNA-binding NarL/FixJ family response regulator